MMTNSFYLLGIIQFLLSLHSYTSSKVISSTSSPLPSPSPAHPLKIFNVVKKFGAKNDGKTDATQAFSRAWKAACASSKPSQIYVPPGTYLLRPIIFEGNNKCILEVLFRIDGTLIPHNVTYREENWIVFHNVDGLRITGGILDAQGKTIWDCKEGPTRLMKCSLGAKSLSFDNCKNVIVDGLTSRNSQMFHITIDTCENIHMEGLTITADGDSPNTDGIHMEESKGITIMHSQIRTGDDCISIGSNNHNIWVENVFCGPGHGVSIGSLGRYLSEEGVAVKNVTVKSSTFIGTYNGVRIKTYSTPMNGIVKDIYFLGATIVDVRYPIIIDQYYCPHDVCPPAQGSGIQISNVIYKGIHGTSSTPDVVTFNCSSRKPCQELILQDIKLSYSHSKPICHHKNAYWKVLGDMQPHNCLGNFHHKFVKDRNSYLSSV